MKSGNTGQLALIGYSGHAYVAADIFASSGKTVTAYCDKEEKPFNPFNLKYLGPESVSSVIETLKEYDYFIALGDHQIRKRIFYILQTVLGVPVNAVHSSAIIASSAQLAAGIFIAANVTINPLVKIGNGAICNTSCTIDHECVIGDFAHIAPGAVLCGNVKIGEGSFVGANAVIRQGITIGKEVMIGAGSVVIKDIPDGAVMAGNPQKSLNKK